VAKLAHELYFVAQSVDGVALACDVKSLDGEQLALRLKKGRWGRE